MTALTDPREPLLALLRTHLSRALEPTEAAMAQTVFAFVRNEPCCAERQLAVGHLTGSAWIIDPSRTHTLLTHHRKLDKWLQLGGHADGCLDLLAVATREAREESGLTTLRVLDEQLFDVDRHWIPPRRTDPGHYHYDLRFCFVAELTEPLVRSDESHDLAWVELSRLSNYSTEESLARMARKTVRGPTDGIRRASA